MNQPNEQVVLQVRHPHFFQDSPTTQFANDRRQLLAWYRVFQQFLKRLLLDQAAVSNAAEKRNRFSASQ